MHSVTQAADDALAAVERGIFAVAEHLAPSTRNDRVGWPVAEPDLVLEALVEALLGSRVRAEAVASGMSKLEGASLLSVQSLRRLGSDNWCSEAFEVLSSGSGFPLVRQKVGYLRRTLDRVGSDLGVLRGVLNGSTAAIVRSRVLSTTCGLGPKQSSYFLRQVGHPDPVAVIDVHVLAYMRLAGLCEDHRPPASLGRYEELECRLLSYAMGRGLPFLWMDHAIWVAMRVWRSA